MPSDQYSLELTNETVAVLDRKISRVTGMTIGDTTILLLDKSESNMGLHTVDTDTYM